MSNVNQFSFGDGDTGIGGKVKPWKAEANRTYRLSFMWWKGTEIGKPDLDGVAPQFAGANTNYIKGVGHIINEGPEHTKVAGEAPKMRIATIIAVWPTSKDGNLDKSGLARGDIEVLPWVISGDKFTLLKNLNKEFAFGSHDFTATCSDAGYQSMTFTPCKESLLRTMIANPKAEEIVNAMLAKGQEVLSTINDHVGRKMSPDAIRTKTGISGGGSSSGGGSGPSVETMSTGDIDSMVDSLLDS